MTTTASRPGWTELLAPYERDQPMRHQVEGVDFLLAHKYAALFDEPGLGKSYQVIAAASVLWLRGVIDQVLVLAPASVRSVWLDPEVGQVAKHSPVPYDLVEFHRKVTRSGWSSPDDRGPAGPPQPGLTAGVNRFLGSWPGKGPLPKDKIARLRYIVTNYEFVVPDARYEHLLQFLKAGNTMLVIDEGAYIKTHNSKRTKRALKIREKCTRVVLLNGTPVGNTLTDLFAQMKALHPSIIGLSSFWAFKNYYCRMGGYQNKQIVGYVNVDDLMARIEPHVLRREKDDCLDLPAKLYQEVRVPLSKKTWDLYCQMRDQMVIELGDQDPVVANHAIVKLVRLAQLTSGLLGGQHDEHGNKKPAAVVGQEKVDWFTSWFADQLEADPNTKVLVWCRFTREQEQVVAALTKFKVAIGRIYGRQGKLDREQAIKVFERPGPAVLIGQPQAGGFGLNLQACHLVVYLSNDYNLLTRQQSEDRVHRPGQRYQATYYDVVATGPQGQATVDRAVTRALKRKEDLATWTTNHWVRALNEE